MTYEELNSILGQLDHTMYALECAYAETGGEVTEETEQMEFNITGLQELLCTDGVDMLGRWLLSKEDKKKALKKEKDYLTRQITAIDNSIDFIKGKMHDVMAMAGEEKVKGIKGYSFTRTISTTTTVDKTMLKDMFQGAVEEAVRNILPEDVTVSLSASVKALPEGAELPSYYMREETPTVRFTKPRGSKED